MADLFKKKKKKKEILFLQFFKVLAIILKMFSLLVRSLSLTLIIIVYDET